MEINKLTIAQIHQAYKDGSLKPIDLVHAYRKAYEEHSDINAYLEFFDDAEEQAIALEKSGFDDKNMLWGIPGAIKDNFSMKGRKMSCASHILENYVSPYNAVVMDHLEEHQFINLGRLNMDEFAMGATGRYSYYGPTLNPLNKERLVGGSSCGSAAAVAGGMAAFTLGSDTGGSSRLPASYAGICGFKPTHGAIPRSGLTAFAPSLDVPGILARTPADIGYVFEAIAGLSPMDESSIDVSKEGLSTCQPVKLEGVKVAFFSALLAKASPSVIKAFELAKEWLTAHGAIIVDANFDISDVLLKSYYATACSEAASSLARLDGIRYGAKVEADNIDELFVKTRHNFLGKEVHRRILLGNYFLKQENYADWYDKASHVRAALRDKVSALQDDGCQFFVLPGFGEAPPIDTPEEDSYASDLVGVFANLFGGPALALPALYGESNLPVSFQLLAPWGNDALIIRVGQMWYQYFMEKNEKK